MTNFGVVALAIAFLGGFALAESALSRPSYGPQESNRQQAESPIACVRSALSPEQRKRHFDELGPQLRARKKSVRELPDGFEFEFSSDAATFQLAAEWAAGEQVCCPFFDIDLRMVRDHGPLLLRLSGRDGVKQFIEAEGSAWLKQ